MREGTIKDKINQLESALADASREIENLNALATLIRNNGHEKGPTVTRYHLPVREVLVGIGRDHTARIMLFEDDIDALQHILGQEYEF